MAGVRRTKIVKTEERNALDAALVASAQAPERIDGVLIGRLVGFDDAARALVDLPYARFTEPVAARATVPLDPTAVGREVAVMFEGGRPDKPLVIGLIQAASGAPRIAEQRDVEIDGERILLTAEHEIVLRCGKASITLTRAGKVLIRGEYLLSRSTGANCIKGGSIHLN